MGWERWRREFLKVCGFGNEGIGNRSKREGAD